MLSFERGKNIKGSLNIGYAAKRDFNSLLEAAKWAYQYPEILTEGELSKWELIDYGYPKNAMEIDDFGYSLSLPILESRIKYNNKLNIVKWVKANITLCNDYMSLKESKFVIDILEVLLDKKELNFFDNSKKK